MVAQALRVSMVKPLEEPVGFFFGNTWHCVGTGRLIMVREIDASLESLVDDGVLTNKKYAL